MKDDGAGVRHTWMVLPSGVGLQNLREVRVLGVCQGMPGPCTGKGCCGGGLFLSKGGSTPVVYLFGGVESRAKNSKVAHEHTEHREHGEFILVQAS